MPEIDTVHAVYDCSTGGATDIPLSVEEFAEHAAKTEAAQAEQSADAEHRRFLLDAVHASTDPAVSALAELLGVR